MQTQPRTALHPQGFRIEFHADAHAYFVNGEQLPSVTTLVKKWFPQFDAEATARGKAEREGGSPEALLGEWARKRDQAAAFGTKIHSMVDRILQEKNDRAADDLPSDAREKSYLVAIKESLARIEKSYEFVESEKIIFSPEHKVAGTLDLLMRNKTTGEYVVGDWKTNRQIKYAGFRDETGSGPCQGLANCNFIHYSLQASAYAVILTGEGYIPPAVQNVRGVLMHLSEKAGRVVCDYIKTKDLTAQTREIFKFESAK